MSELEQLGKYKIVREIARSNDIVYEAIDPVVTRRVAIKQLSLPYHLDDRDRSLRIQRFYREAKAAGTLTHKNIVTIYDIANDGERHFIVMEYLEGRSVREILDSHGVIPIKEAIEIALQLCDGLAYAHDHGVIHRDVKPENAHVLNAGMVKLTDFGIARIIADPTITALGQVYGTPYYMAPEQLAAKPLDHRVDVFSLGVMLYEMLTGKKPFNGDSLPAIMYAIVRSQPAKPVGLPKGMLAILEKALAKNSHQRYLDMAQFSDALRAEKAKIRVPKPPKDAPRRPRPDEPYFPDATGPEDETPPAPRPLAGIVDDAAIARASQLLEDVVGPIARVFAGKAAREAASREEFYRLLSDNVPLPNEREAFFKKLLK